MKNKSEVSAQQMATMLDLGFKLQSVVWDDKNGQFTATWRFDSSGPMAVHNLEVQMNAAWLIKTQDAINHIYHAGWGDGRDETQADLRRVLGCK